MKSIKLIAALLLSAIAFNAHAQKVIELNKEEFIEKVCDYTAQPKVWKYKGTLPCVIDFSAKWCGPCRRMEPILEEMAEKYEGKIIIYKIDVDKEYELSSIFGVKSIPAFLFCPASGEKPRGAKGAYPADEFEQFIITQLLSE